MRHIKKKPARSKKKKAVRESMRERARKSYRKRAEDFELLGNVVLRALDFIDEDAKLIPVRNELTGRTEPLPVIRLTHVAELLNVSYQTLWRWYSETDQIPAPVLVDNTMGREYSVYHLEEVRVMVAVIGQHLTQFRYYRSDHSGTKRRLFDQINALRDRNFLGEKPNGDQEKRPHAARKGKHRRIRR